MNKSFGKLAVGVRVGSRPDPVFFKCWTQLLLSGVCDVVLAPVIEVPTHWAANVLADQFLTTEADTLLFLDDDAAFLPTDVITMQDNPENDAFGVVQGLSVSAKPPHNPLLLGVTEIPGRYEAFTLNKDAPDTTVEVGMVGLHFTFIRRSAFDAVRAADKGADLFFAWGDSGHGEDEWFCRQARQAGVKVGVDISVSIEHRVTVSIAYDKSRGESVYHAYSNYAFMQTILKQDERVKQIGG